MMLSVHMKKAPDNRFNLQCPNSHKPKQRDIIILIFFFNNLVFSDYFYISDIIKNHDVLITVIVMLKFKHMYICNILALSS